MWTYLTKVIVISGFYVGCTGTIMGHGPNKQYFVALTCDDAEHIYSLSEWMERKELKKVEKGSK